MATHVPSPPKDFNGARVTVMGLGRFGGGVGVTRWLAAQGARVLVTDTAPAPTLEKSLGEISELVESGVVTLRLGEHREEDFTCAAADVVIANPAVPKPWENPFLNAATESGVPITTEIRLLVERLPNRDRTIGVTGTAGKSTTAAMIAHILRELGERVHLGGNIGGSMLEELESIGDRDWVVLELSSAQLCWLGEGVGFEGASSWSPEMPVITNIAPNHLDWHGSMEHYVASKRVIGAKAGHVVVWDQAMADMFGHRHATMCSRLVFARGSESRGASAEVLRTRAYDLAEMYLQLPGSHNYRNANMAVHALMDLGFVPELALRALVSFPGLAHRMELADGAGGIRGYNDSKCTTPEAAALAVGAFEEEGECGAGRVHLICGGYDKKIDLGPMVDAAARCKGVYTIGVTGPAIAAAVRAKGGKPAECGTLDVAVGRAAGAASSGDVILLSPGCASWDQFENYEERGESFKRLVREALGGQEGGK